MLAAPGAGYGAPSRFCRRDIPRELFYNIGEAMSEKVCINCSWYGKAVQPAWEQVTQDGKYILRTHCPINNRYVNENRPFCKFQGELQNALDELKCLRELMGPLKEEGILT